MLLTNNHLVHLKGDKVDKRALALYAVVKLFDINNFAHNFYKYLFGFLLFFKSTAQI